jgi:hypothetical protein
MRTKIFAFLILTHILVSVQNSNAQSGVMGPEAYADCVLNSINQKNTRIKGTLSSARVTYLKNSMAMNSRQLSTLEAQYNMQMRSIVGNGLRPSPNPVVIPPHLLTMQKRIADLKAANLLLGAEYNQYLSQSLLAFDSAHNYNLKVCERNKSTTTPSLATWVEVWELAAGDANQLALMADTPLSRSSFRTNVTVKEPLGVVNLSTVLDALGYGPVSFVFQAQTPTGVIRGSFSVPNTFSRGDSTFLNSVLDALIGIEDTFGRGLVSLDWKNTDYRSVALLDAANQRYEESPYMISTEPLNLVGGDISGFGSDSTPDGANTPDGGFTPNSGPR